MGFLQFFWVGMFQLLKQVNQVSISCPVLNPVTRQLYACACGQVVFVRYVLSCVTCQGRVTEQTVDIPHALHASLQSAKGALIRAVRDECGGVLIRFPSSTSASDKVLLKGPADDVELAKKLLLDLANDTVSLLSRLLFFTQAHSAWPSSVDLVQ